MHVQQPQAAGVFSSSAYLYDVLLYYCSYTYQAYRKRGVENTAPLAGA